MPANLQATFATLLADSTLNIGLSNAQIVSLSAADLTVPATTTDLVAALNSSDATIAATNPSAADAFAVNGGRNLPSAMTIASDRAIYLQGDYNTIGRKPAAIMADTISVLSVNCVSPFNYNGSLVSLGTPLEFSGWYRSGGNSDSYFNPPNRNYTYDTSFNAFPSLPPMTPSVIYLQQDVFRRN